MISDPFRLDDRVALVSGATRGIGLATAALLLRQGARVIISSENEQDVAAVVSTLGPGAHGIPCDVGNWQQCADLVMEACLVTGQLDILVCCAGVPGQGNGEAAIDPDDLEQVWTINLRSMVALTNAAMPLMAKQGCGATILVGSIAASRGNQKISSYALAKAGVVQLARDLAVKWGPHNVRANSVSPGLIATEFSAPLLDDAAFMARRLQMTPLRRPGRAEDVAGAVAFLASEAGAFINGHDLVIDGGTLISDGS